MSDPFVTRLAALAPDVDLAASRELFESLRSGDGSADQQPANRRWLLAAACLLLLVAGAVGVWAVAGRNDDRVPGTPPADDTTDAAETAQATTGDGTEFRLIAMEAVGDFDRRAIHVADTRDELDALLGGFRDSFDRYAADVAFQQSAEIAVVIERPDNACPLEIERFVPIEFDSTWRVEWADKSDEPCEDIGLGWVYLVAIPRTALTGVDRIVLPAEPDGSGFELGAVVADPAIEPPSGSVVERPPVPEPQEVQARLERFPIVSQGIPVDLAALIAAHDRGEDWTGSVSGFLFHEVRAGEWWLCNEILESFPEECGTGFRLLDAPALYVEDPELFDEQRSEGASRASVVISRGLQPVVGTWFDDAAIFVEHAVQVPTELPQTNPAEVDEATLDAATTLVLDVNSGTDGGIAIGASNQAQLDLALMQFPDVETPPEIDFDTHIAIAFTTVDDGCRAELRSLNMVRIDDGPLRLMPQLVESVPPDLTCTAIGIPRLFVVAVERGVLPDTFEFFTPPNAVPNEAGTLSTIDLAAPATYSTVRGAPVPPEPITFAASQAPLDALAASVGAAQINGSVDFESLVVATFTIAPGACADDFAGFDVTGRVWTTRFVDADGCLDAEESRWAVVLIERPALAGGVELRHGEATVSVDPAFSIVAARWSCGETDLPLFGATLDLPAAVDVRIEVRDGDDVTGWGMLGNGGDAGTVGLDFGMTGSPSTTSVMVVIDLATSREVARMPLGHLPLPTCG